MKALILNRYGKRDNVPVPADVPPGRRRSPMKYWFRYTQLG